MHRSITSPLSRPLADAVTQGRGSGLGPFYGVMANPPTITTTDTSTTTISGGVLTTKDSAALKWTAPPTMVWATDNRFRVVGDGTNTDIGAFVAVEFDTDAPQVEFRMVRFNSAFNIRVDNELVQDSSFTFDAAGTLRLVKLDWSGDANPTKMRRYRIAGYNLPIGGLFLPPGYSITYPTSQDSRPLMVFLGDSYTLGTGARGPDRVYAHTLATALGYDYWGDGLGGSGWNTASTNTPLERINKRLGILTRTPAAIVTALGYNDAGGNMTTAATAYDAAIARLQTLFPGVPVVSLGPWTPLGTTANLDTVASTISGRAAADGVDFVSIADIITAANKATYTGGDNVHPTQDGHNYLGRTAASRVRPNL